MVKLLSRDYWLLWLMMVAAACLVLFSLVSDRHVLFNLEPYPDGLIYVGSAKNLATRGHLSLQRENTTLKPKVPPLYSVVLAPAFILNTNPAGFVVINTLLLVLSTALFFMFLKNWFPTWLAYAGVALYLGHAYLIWLPTVPMSENLGMFLTVAAMWTLTTKQWRWELLFLSVTIAIALVFTKYIYIGPATAIVLISFIRSFTQKQWRYLLLAGVLLMAYGVLFLMVSIWNEMNFLDIFTWLSNKRPAASVIPVTQSFYSFTYSGRNFLTYASYLFGLDGRFLWYTYPLTSPLLSVTGIVGLAWLLKTQKYRYLGIVVALLFLSLLPILLIFLSTDSRYIITIVPLLIAGGIGFTSQILTTHKKLALGILAVLCLSVAYTQLQLFRQIIVQNLLHRSVAWQYEATKEIRTFMSDKNDAYLITALPPYLIDLYYPAEYNLLPLSPKQEFMHKGQNVWGIPTNFMSDLPEYFQTLSEDGKTMYITNAYITHLHEVTVDYEALKKQFRFEQVYDGCQQTCSIYKLTPMPN